MSQPTIQEKHNVNNDEEEEEEIPVTECLTPFQEDGTEASICVPKIFKSHV
jgi:hypothetical protein